MRSPAGWVEPGQRPDFDEYTLVIGGALHVEYEGGSLVVRHRPGRAHARRRMGPLLHAGRRRVRRRLPSRLLPRHRPPRRIVKPGAIGVVVHPRRDSRAMIECVVRWADRHGKEVRGLEEARDLMPPSVRTVPEEELAVGAGLVIGLGGDGTILRALKLATEHEVPVLGVNLGRLAFLAEVNLDELPGALDAIDRDEHWIEERAVMTVTGTCFPTRLHGLQRLRAVADPGQRARGARGRGRGRDLRPLHRRRAGHRHARPARPPTRSRPAGRSSRRATAACWSRRSRRTRRSTAPSSCTRPRACACTCSTARRRCCSRPTASASPSSTRATASSSR